MQSNKMDRGSDALKGHVANATKMDVRQTRRGWLQECLGCEARTEFKYFIDGTQVAESLEEASCACRFFCTSCYPFTAEVKELNTQAEMLTIHRPGACPAGSCKCCCYQSISVSSGGQDLGKVVEDCYYCVPQMTAFDSSGNKLYKIHSPTCCGGMCVQCCSEGNPCFGRGCCKVPFRIYSADQQNTNGDAEYIGKIVKVPKSMRTEVFTDADAFEVDFPKDATVEQKGLLIGTAVFINALFFEENQNDGAAA